MVIPKLCIFVLVTSPLLPFSCLCESSLHASLHSPHLPPSFSSLSGTQCGYLLPPVVVSASETLAVTFQSDGRLTDRGFSAKWEAVYPEDITGTEG